MNGLAVIEVIFSLPRPSQELCLILMRCLVLFRSVRAGLTLLVTLIQIVKLILAHKIHVVPMLYVKIRVRAFIIHSSQIFHGR